MYSLIVVDDEPAIRNGLATRIDWHSLGFDVTSTFEDGREALDYVRSNPVDVVLTDIKMSVMSGLELAEHIHEEGIRTVVVLLTGFRDFEFARKAMRVGVRHYLLKPTQPGEITEVFDSVRETLTVRKSMGRSPAARRKILRLVARARRDMLLSLLAGTYSTVSMLSTAWRHCMLDLPSPNAPARYQRATVHHPGRERVTASISDTAPLLVDQPNCQISVLFESDSVLHVLTVGGGCPHDEPVKVAEQLLTRDHSADMDLFSNRSRTAVASTLEEVLSQFTPGCQDRYRDDNDGAAQTIRGIVQAILTDTPEQVRNLTMSYLARCTGSVTDSIESLRQVSVNLVASVFAETVRHRGAFGSDTTINYEWPFSLNDYSEISEWTVNAVLGIMADSDKTDPATRDVVDQIQRFVETHLGEDLSLDRVSAEFYYSSGCLSRLFAAKTGINYSDYVTERRIARSITLLAARPDLRVSDVATQVGYQDAKYFARVFRSLEGLTPSAYRRLLGSRHGAI